MAEFEDSSEPDHVEPENTAKRPGAIFGVWGLAIFSFAFLANVNATPQLATFGLGALFIFAMAIFLFLTPTALASTEMGTTWPKTGGIYVWTRMAFGEGAGFVIIWLEWANFVVAWPGIMGGLTVQTAYVIDPGLEDNTAFIMAVVIFVTWIAAGIALRGLRTTGIFAWWAVVVGAVLPSVLLSALTVVYLVQGNPAAMDVSGDSLIPTFDFSTLAFMSGALLMFSGIEIAAVHASEVKNPGHTIPRANLITVILCAAVFAPMTLALAVLVPAADIDIVTGALQAGDVLNEALSLNWVTAAMGFCLVTGTIAALIQIINGPSRGLMIAGKQGGNLPPILQTENKLKMPVNIILLQALISSVLAIGYSLLGSVQNAWFMFLLIQTNMTLIMYGMMFASLVKLRYSRPHKHRPYVIPGKKFGLWLTAGVGGLVCLFGIIISFVPTEEAAGMPGWVYIGILVLGTAAFVAAPFVFWIFRKPSWRTDPEAELADAEGR